MNSNLNKIFPENLLDDFILQSNSKSLKTNQYLNEYQGLKVKVSFGQGRPAKIPWISFTPAGITTSNGYYPVFLFYKKENILILSYGVSETIEHDETWPKEITENKKKINQFIDNPFRYGESYIYLYYEIVTRGKKIIYLKDGKKISVKEISKDLDRLLEFYKSSLEQQKQNNLEGRNIKAEIMEKIKNQKTPDFLISNAKSDLKVDRESISKALIELKKTGDIHYIIKTPDTLHISHIDGQEINWDQSILTTKNEKGLFNREGDIFIDPGQFFEYISSLPSSTKDENEQLFKELEKLVGKEYEEKVLEIATKNIKLIRRITFGVIENEDLTESEIREYYKYVLRGLCRSVEKFDYNKGFALSTLANQWILQGSTRARSKIIQKRMIDRYGEQVGIQSIDERARDIKNSTDTYPTFDELLESFHDELIGKSKATEKKKIQIQEDIEKSKGINKLYNLLFNVGRIKFSYPTEESKKSIFSALEKLEQKHKEIIVLRYRLKKYLNEYNVDFYNLDNQDSNLLESGENVMTLEEIGELFDLTRERVRQVEKIALGKMAFFISNQSPSEEIPKIFFSKSINEFLEDNNLKTIKDVISLTPNELMSLNRVTPQKIEIITEAIKEMGYELKQIEIEAGDIDFSKLSERSSNALNKAGILTKKQLTDTNIENIPNIGAKSAKELYTYLEKDTNKVKQREIFADIQTALAFPCANKVSQQNFQHTMTEKIRLSTIENLLLPKQMNELEKLGDEFYFWGIKSTTDKGWDGISLEGLGLFFANKEIFAVGRVVYKLINKQLADYFWAPEDLTNRSYKYMFAFSSIEKVNIPQLSFNQTVGFKENYVTQGFMGLNKIRSRDVANLVGAHLK